MPKTDVTKLSADELFGLAKEILPLLTDEQREELRHSPSVSRARRREPHVDKEE